MNADYLSAELATLDALIAALPPDDILGGLSLTERRGKVLREMASVPAPARPVSEHIAEEMDARGWTHVDLIRRLNGAAWLVVDLFVRNPEPLTRGISARLGRAFGVKPNYFLSLDRAYRESLQPADTTEEETLP